jgi:hypothetical protein
VIRRPSAPPAAVLIALALAGTAHAVPAAGAEPERSERLVLTGPTVAIEGRPLALRVETRGALSGQPVRLLVFVDDRLLDEILTDGARAHVEVPAASLAAGRRRILVKSGSERTWTEVRVLPRAWLWGAGALLLGAAAAAAALARRRRG